MHFECYYYTSYIRRAFNLKKHHIHHNKPLPIDHPPPSLQELGIMWLSKAFVAAFTGVIKYHGQRGEEGCAVVCFLVAVLLFHVYHWSDRMLELV